MRGKFQQVPLAAVVVALIDPVDNPGFDIIESAVGKHKLLDLVLHMAEEALLRSIVPAVAAPGHRLDKIRPPSTFG